MISLNAIYIIEYIIPFGILDDFICSFFFVIKLLFYILQMIFVALFLALAAAAPQGDVVIVRQSQEHDTDTGRYSFR